MMDFVVPGKIICQFQEGYEVGEGAYLLGNDVIASTAGTLEFQKVQMDGVEKVLVDVVNPKSRNLVPTVGKHVTCQIARVTQAFCVCRILMVESTILRGPFMGHLRKEDVRMTAKDKVQMGNCFRIGDHIAARVVSYDASLGFLLSTAEHDLGVVVALSKAGCQMEPLSYREMRCPRSGSVENRKVACPRERHVGRP